MNKELLSKKLIAFVVSVLAICALAVVKAIAGDAALDAIKVCAIAYLGAQGAVDVTKVIKETSTRR